MPLAGVDFPAGGTYVGRANVACDGIRCLRAVLPFSYRATSSAGAFAGGFLRFRERKTLMPIGTVKFFNSDKGYGFIAPEDGGKDSFVHISAVERAGMATLNKDQRVSYEVEIDRRGKESAINLQAV